MTQAVIYSRFSPCPGQNENLSNAKQEERCREYCKRKGYYIHPESFRDDAVSGTQLERPGLNDALSTLSEGMVLVVDRGDRLARDVIVDLTIRQRIKATGATLEFADGSPNEDSPEGRLISGVFALIAAFERDRIAVRTSAGLKRKQAKGEYLGRPPVGYRVEGKQLVEDEQEQKAIRKARKLSSRGLHSLVIARHLTEEFGFFRGKRWSARTVRKLLENP